MLGIAVSVSPGSTGLPEYDYYIDSVAGSDSNAGTSAAAPWATLGKAAETVGSVAVLHFARGSTFTVDAGAFGEVALSLALYGSGDAPVVNGISVSTYDDLVFALAAPAFWLDASYTAGLFQDALGTTAVSADGQSVGYWLDKAHVPAEGRRNLLNWSADLTKTAQWTASQATLAANKITANGTSNQHYVTTASAVLANGVQRTFTARLQADTATHAHILFTGCNAYVQMAFADGTIVGSNVGSGSGLTTSIADEGGGIYRLRITVTPNTSGSIRIYPLAGQNLTAAPSENSSAAMFVEGCQLEAAASATAYQATTGSWTTGVDWSASTMPTYVASAVNSKPALRFNGSSQRMAATQLGFLNNKPAAHIIVVLKRSAAGADHGILQVLSGSGGTRFRMRATSADRFDLNVRRLDADSPITATAISAAPTGWCIVEAIADYVEQTFQVFVNSAEVGYNAAVLTSGSTSATDSTAMYLGNDTSAWFNGDIAEMIGQGAVIADADRSRILRHLADKYDIDIGDFSLVGAWTWFNDPRAIAFNGKQVVGVVDNVGHVRVVSYDAHTHLPVILKKTIESPTDDHDNPAFAVRSDGKLLAAYSAHIAAERYAQVTSAIGSAQAWGTATGLDASLLMSSYSYANLVRVPAESKIYDFFRAVETGVHTWSYSTSDDDGATWAAGANLFSDDQRHYSRYVLNGSDRIDVVLNEGHPNEVATNSTYHIYFQGGNAYKSDGTLIGSLADDLPLSDSDFTLIWDGSTAAGNSWVWDIVIDPATGYPVVVYAVFPSTTDHRYRYARWTGSAWDDHEVVEAGTYLYAGEAYYSGGICIDPQAPSTVYYCKVVSGVHQLHRAVTTDGGATWSETKLTNGTDKVFRPVIVRGQTVEPRLAYVTGSYTTFQNYYTRIGLMRSDAEAVA